MLWDSISSGPSGWALPSSVSASLTVYHCLVATWSLMIAEGLVMNPPRASQENPKQCPLYLSRGFFRGGLAWKNQRGRRNSRVGEGVDVLLLHAARLLVPCPARARTSRQDRRWAGRGDALQFLSLVSNICSGVLSFAIQ